jgi:hypothetical protein
MSPRQDRPPFESWGRYPRLPAEVRPLFWKEDFPPPQVPGTKMLAVGMGRSYGDVCLLQNGTLLRTPNLDRLISFDAQTGLLRCEAGVTLAQILDFAVPRGWFLPVSPGTKYVTVGGAIANDIHGKNHHVAGTFGLHTPCFELIRSDGTQLVCSPTENPDVYSATIGGMGLTGFISWAEVQMRPIVSRRIRYHSTQFVGLEEFVALSQASTQEYSVAWIDCVAQGRNFARGIFIQGEHDENPGPLTPLAKPKLTLPFDLPQPLFRGRLQYPLLPQANQQTTIRVHRLRAILLPPGPHPAMESTVWRAGPAPVPMCSAVGHQYHGDDPAIEGDYHVRAGFFSSRDQGLWRYFLARDDVVSHARYHPGSGFSYSARGELRPVG